jgi:hypothetical protein
MILSQNRCTLFGIMRQAAAGDRRRTIPPTPSFLDGCFPTSTSCGRGRSNRRHDMRFRIDVNTLDGKLSYERDEPADALAVAEGGKQSLGVTITDTEEDKTYSPEEFGKRFGR